MKHLLSKPGVEYFIFYFGLLSLLRWQFDLSLLFLWLGGMLGMFFSWVDRLAHVYFTRPFEQLSLQVKGLISQKRYGEALVLLEQRKSEQRHLTVRSALFLVVWIFLAFFVITSTGSFFAVGMVMAIGLTSVLDMARDLSDLDQLKWWLFWQIKRTFSDNEARYFVVFFMLIFAMFSLVIIT